MNRPSSKPPESHRYPSASVHSCIPNDLPAGRVEGRPCRMLACKRVFKAKRQDQCFCSAECRRGYFSLARNLGLRLIESIRLREPWAREAVRHLGRDEDPVEWSETVG